MSQMIITFPEPQRIVLVQGAELSLSFAAPQMITLQVEGIQGPAGGGGGGGGATNLAWDPATRTVSSDTGTDAVITLADSTNAGLMSSASVVALASALQPGAVIPWVNVSGKPTFATVATSGLASDLTGILPAASFNDTTHGARAGGTLHANAIAAGAAGFMSGADKTKLDAITGTNTGDQTSIVGITGTKAQFDTAVTDGNFLYVGDPPTAHTHLLAAGATDVTITAANLNALDDGVNTALHFHDADRARANHTGTQAVGTITGLATVATSGSASDLGAGTLPNARLAAFGSGDVSFAAGGGAGTIAADAVTNAKLANMATATFKGRTTAGTGDPEDMTATQATAILNTFTTTLKGLVPASGGASGNFLRDDGTWAASGGGSPVTVQDEGSNITTALGTLNFVGAGVTVAGGATATVTIPGGSGSPGGSTGEVQFNNAGAFAGAANARIEGNELRLPYIASPAAPAAGGLKLFGLDFGGGVPAFELPSGRVVMVQSDLGDFNVKRFTPGVGSNSTALESSMNTGVFGGAVGAATPAVTNLHSMMPRLDILVAAAATTAISGWRNAAGSSVFLRVGKDANAPGGFLCRTLWAPATGGTVATNRAFAGLTGSWSTAPTDVEPSTRINIIGMGWDAADTNIQIMHNDGSGVATKIDLGASFPVPTTDRPPPYEIQLYSPNSLTQSVSYRVIRYNATDKTIAAEATGTITTNLPAVTTLLSPNGAMSVGGTSSIIGVALMGIYAATEY